MANLSASGPRAPECAEDRVNDTVESLDAGKLTFNGGNERVADWRHLLHDRARKRQRRCPEFVWRYKDEAAHDEAGEMREVFTLLPEDRRRHWIALLGAAQHEVSQAGEVW